MNDFASAYFFIFSNLFWINLILAVILVIFERKNPTSTWLWLMVLFFLPVVGFLLYLIIGQDLSKKKKFKNKADEDDCFDEMVKEQEKLFRSKEFREENSEYFTYEDIINLHLKGDKSIFTYQNEVELIFDGHDKFKELFESINKAKNYIYIEYYKFKSDLIGSEFLDILTKKANEGIEVKLLVDGMGGRKLAKKSLEPLKQAGGEVAFFFPSIIPYVNTRVNYRNHRKICIIDGKEAFLGGFNVGDEYLGLSKKFGYWRDTHIKLKGEAISFILWQFFVDWRFATNEELKGCQTYIDNPESTKTGIQIVSSGPDSKWPGIKDGYFKMISNAKHKLYIESPYFIPDDSIFEAIKNASLSGVDVRVMIPNKPDHPFVYWAGTSYMGQLLEAGVKFYTYQKGFLHSKVLIMDDFVSSVGTANLDIRSFKLNFEINAFIYSKDINEKLTKRFIDDFKNCKEITLEEYNKRSNIIKIKESFSRLLSPIL
jgi:cardiolipin synthase